MADRKVNSPQPPPNFEVEESSVKMKRPVSGSFPGVSPSGSTWSYETNVQLANSFIVEKLRPKKDDVVPDTED